MKAATDRSTYRITFKCHAIGHWHECIRSYRTQAADPDEAVANTLHVQGRNIKIIQVRRVVA